MKRVYTEQELLAKSAKNRKAWELVLAFTLAPVFVTTLPIDVEAVVTSDCRAREPEVKVASVRLRVA
jgi:hypothetical protein